MGVAINLTAHRLPRDNENTFTMIPNSILRDTSISCKAKAVLCYLIGERDNSFTPMHDGDVWTMTIKGLASAFKESIGSIKRSVDELMQTGYLRRIDVLGENNLRVRIEYELFEEPIKNADGKPIIVKESDLSNSLPEEADTVEAEAIETVVEHNICADIIAEDYDAEVVNDITNIIKNTLLTKKKIIWVGGIPHSTSRVKKALYRIEEDDVCDIIENMSTNVRCKNKYLLSCLFNIGDKKTTSLDSIVDAKKTAESLIRAVQNDQLENWIENNYHRSSALIQSLIRRYLYNNIGMPADEVDNLVL